jgi:hypothetical protein
LNLLDLEHVDLDLGVNLSLPKEKQAIIVAEMGDFRAPKIVRRVPAHRTLVSCSLITKASCVLAQVRLDKDTPSMQTDNPNKCLTPQLESTWLILVAA